jgi:chromosome segregation ATPase
MAIKTALDHVLSLIKATMAQAGGGAGPLLQVHEETQTLIFKGSSNQRAALEDALTALGVNVPRSDDRVEAARKEVDEWRTRVEQERAAAAQQTHDLQSALQEVRQQSRKLEAEALERAVEVERLKVRLEQAQRERAAAQEKDKGK